MLPLLHNIEQTLEDFLGANEDCVGLAGDL